MKKLNILPAILLLFISILVFSCKDESKSETQEETAAQTSSSEEMKQNMAKSSDLKYNPAHGEEGHRCDLPVGAPLDQPKAAQQQEMTTSPVRLKSAMPKINPPHGQPGHDCSVPVGAELKG
ncbi:hypothetical protein E0K83_04365 [Gramella sp. BOM4]|nr:hypothetical protein [Christiangramia bathymodioli]